jgi:hypothetical protein
LAWIAELRSALNGGLLPPEYYAQAEQIAGPLGGVQPTAIVSEAVQLPPKTRFTFSADAEADAAQRQTLAIREHADDAPFALLEIVSPGNKSSRHAIKSFVEKAVEALYRGYHLLIVDLFPPGPRDPNGIHAAIWGEICDDSFTLPPEEPLTLVSYSAGLRKKAYIEPTAVGRALIDIPLFLTPEMYVNVPLEATYLAAYRGVPRRWRDVLEAPKTA